MKSAHSRRNVPLSPGMAVRLWALGADRPERDRVFSSSAGQPLQDNNLSRRVLAPATEAAGLGEYVAVKKDCKTVTVWRSWVTFHTFRHTCASLLFEATRDVKQVSAWLGHAYAAFTLRTYVHLMDDGVGDAAFLDDVANSRGALRQEGART